MVIRHSRLDRHIHQARHTTIGKYSRLAHRQVKYIRSLQTKPLGSHIPVITDTVGKGGLKSRQAWETIGIGKYTK